MVQKAKQLKAEYWGVTLLALSAVGLIYPCLSYGDGPEEAFPESRFGHIPARQTQTGSYLPLASDPKQGYDQSFAKNQVEDMEAENSDGVAGPSVSRRSPAGLVLDGSVNATHDARTSNAPSRPQTTQTIYQSRSFEARVASGSTSEPAPLMPSLSGVQEVAIIANDLGFFPKAIFVTRDVPVRLFVTGASHNTLCIMLDSFQVRKQVRPSRIEEITFTPSVPGKYRFYCPVNGMEGNLIVKELTTDLPPQASHSMERVPASQ